MPHPSAFALSMTPAKQSVSGTVAHVIITDKGTAPLTVHSVVYLLHGTVCSGTASKGIVTVSPAAFSLKAGHGIVTTVTIPKGTPSGDYAVVYGADAGGAGNLRVSGNVASQVLVGGSATCHPKALPVAHTGGISMDTTLIIVLPFLAVCAFLAVMIARGTKRRRPHNETPYILSNGWY
jgi:hypothetical protein